jgi:hypothetical protein
MAAPTDDRPAAAPAFDSRADRVARTVWDWRTAGDAAKAEADRRRLAAGARRSALLRAAIGVIAAGLVWLWKPVLGVVVLAITAAILLVALVSPLGAYRAIAAGLERFGHWVGLGVTWVLMALIFYLLFFPVGRVRRARGRSWLTFGPEPARPSYWAPVDWRRVTPESYRRQY